MSWNWTSVIFANLTAEDYRHWHDNKVPYTGSTAMATFSNASGSNYHSPGGLEPYIATGLSEFQKAVDALGWTKFYITIGASNQWIVRQYRTPEEIIWDNLQVDFSA
jgi:hypothetical protein